MEDVKDYATLWTCDAMTCHPNSLMNIFSICMGLEMCEPIHFKHDEIVMIAHEEEQRGGRKPTSMMLLCFFNIGNKRVAFVGRREISTNVTFVEVNDYVETLVSLN